MRVASSYNAGGMSAGSMQGSISTNNTRKRTGAARKTGQNKVIKKRVNYNHREIRSALLRASKAQSAGKVLTQAKGKLANLLRAKGTGQFNESELAAAIIHAKRMVRCAHMKTQNLKQEEQMQKKNASEAKAEEQQRKNDLKLRMKRKEQNLKQKARNEKAQNVQKQKRQHQQLMQRRRIHRNMEHEKMEEADLEYKKNMGNASRDNSCGMEFEPIQFPTAGVELELSADGMKLTEAQIEQQIEQEIAMAMAAEFSAASASVPITSTGAETAASGGSAGAGGEVPVMDVASGGM